MGLYPPSNLPISGLKVKLPDQCGKLGIVYNLRLQIEEGGW